MSDAREDDLLTTDAGGSGTGDALTPEGAGHRPAPGTEGSKGAKGMDGADGGLVTDFATTDAGPRGADHGQDGGDEQSPDSAGSGRDA
jgi:hypothetical protein